MEWGAIIGVVISSIVTLVGLWIKYKASKASKDKLAADILEKANKIRSQSIENQNKAYRDHEKKIIDIVSGVNDDRASELLSSAPNNPKVQSPTNTKN